MSAVDSGFVWIETVGIPPARGKPLAPGFWSAPASDKGDADNGNTTRTVPYAKRT